MDVVPGAPRTIQVDFQGAEMLYVSVEGAGGATGVSTFSLSARTSLLTISQATQQTVSLSEGTSVGTVVYTLPL